jgi:hypothetical protein
VADAQKFTDCMLCLCYPCHLCITASQYILADNPRMHTMGRPEAIAVLDVRADNSAAVALYEKLGFERTAVRRRYYATGGDALVMIRDPHK